MRPLFFEEPENQKLYTYNTCLFFGAKDFLISPILNKDKRTKHLFP